MPVPVGEGFRGPGGRVGYLLRQAHQAMRGAMERDLRELGITASQYSVMSVLGYFPSLTITELASDSMLTQQTTSEIVAGLLRSGRVYSERDPLDRRARRISLTPDGQALLTEAHERVRLLEQRSVDGMGERERARVNRWLVRCAQLFAEHP